MTAASDSALRPAAPGLFQIVLDQPDLDGFTDFISAWLWQGPPVLLVDPGPAASLSQLIRGLDALGIGRPDAILLTHIHLDHAGVAGHLCDRWPAVPIICHRSAIKHLVDPARLWQGSLKTLGATARAYGEIRPVPAERLVDAETCRSWGLRAVATPGHAPHHVSFLVDDVLFAGEAGGVFYAMGGAQYLRPATPPRFFLETHLESIDRLSAIGHMRFCYGHFGLTEDAPRLLAAHRRQLLAWRNLVAETMQTGLKDLALIDACRHRLLQSDPLLASFAAMPAATQRREAGFLNNSIRGVVGYLQEQAG